MKATLLLLTVCFATQGAFAQGTFTYTFDGDSSPMNVWATFQASSNAVATGYLSTGNTVNGYLLQGGHQWSIFSLRFPVDMMTAWPNGYVGNTQLAASYNFDEIDINGGVMSNPKTTIEYYPWIGSPQYNPSVGVWSVTYNVPEPTTTSLFVIGAALLTLTKQRHAAT